MRSGYLTLLHNCYFRKISFKKIKDFYHLIIKIVLLMLVSIKMSKHCDNLDQQNHQEIDSLYLGTSLQLKTIVINHKIVHVYLHKPISYRMFNFLKNYYNIFHLNYIL